MAVRTVGVAARVLTFKVLLRLSKRQAAVKTGPGVAAGNFWVQGIFLQKFAWFAKHARKYENVIYLFLCR